MPSKGSGGDLTEYLRAKEPAKAELAGIWRTAIGLQKVDGLSPSEVVSHFARFIADVWQIHAFGEGNTRTTAIFAIKYLRALGFAVGNDIFADNSYYFRNALVRANYVNLPIGVHPTLIYLERFFANLLLGEKNELRSRHLLVGLHDEPSSLALVKREQVGEQVREQVNFVLPNGIKRLVKILDGEMSILKMMELLKLGGRRNFLEKYLNPAIEHGLVEMTQPDSPRSPTQKYRLTVKGRAVKDIYLTAHAKKHGGV